MEPSPAVRRAPKWLYATLLLVGSMVVLLTAALAVAPDHLRGPLLRVLSARTGRSIRVDGQFTAHFLARHPTITATQVSIGNPGWMPAGDMAQVGRLSLTLTWQFAAVPLAIHRLELENT